MSASPLARPAAAAMTTLKCARATRTGIGVIEVDLALTMERMPVCAHSVLPLGDETGGGAQSIGLCTERRQRVIGLGDKAVQFTPGAGHAERGDQGCLAGTGILAGGVAQN